MNTLIMVIAFAGSTSPTTIVAEFSGAKACYEAQERLVQKLKTVGIRVYETGCHPKEVK